MFQQKSAEIGVPLNSLVPRRAFTLVELLVVVAITGVLLSMLLPAVQSARESARRSQCSNNLRQMALATQMFHDAKRRFPYGRQGDEESFGQHTQLFPHLEESNISLQFDFSITANKNPARFIKIPLFLCPSDMEDRMFDQDVNAHQFDWGKNNYRACAGSDYGRTWDSNQPNAKELNNGIFLTNQATTMKQVTDGLSRTALFSETIRGDANDNRVEPESDLFQVANNTSTNSVDKLYNLSKTLNLATMVGASKQTSYAGRNWIYGNYMTTRYNHVMPPNTFSMTRGNSPNNNGGAITASSRHNSGVNVALADASVRYVDSNIDLALWRALATRAGNETIAEDF